MNELIVSALIGGVLGWIINELLNPVKRKAQKALKENILKNGFDSIEIIPGFIALDNASPYYHKENLHLRDSGSCLFIAIPQNYRKAFEQYKFEIRDSVYLDGSTNLLNAFSNLNITNATELLNNSVEEVALEFLSDFKQWIREI